MTLWERIQALLESAREATLGALMEAMKERKLRKDAAIFSIALIALSAKMAKADGVVTDDEIEAFSHFFTFPAEEASKVRMIYTLAQKDVAGFDMYAHQVGDLFRDDQPVLNDVLDCLFYVALADGVLHPNETELLKVASDAFHTTPAAWRRIKASHLGLDKEDPYAVLGVAHSVDDEALKAKYRALVKECHPDTLIARGVPENLVKISERRMAAINEAYEKIGTERASGSLTV